MPDEVYFMVPSGLPDGGKPEVYQMVPATYEGEEPEVYYMTPEGGAEKWVWLKNFTFNITSAVVRSGMWGAGEYTGAVWEGSFAGYSRIRIVHISGSFYYGAVLDEYRTSIIGITSADASSGSSFELSLGDGVLYAGVYFSPAVPADVSGSCTYSVYGIK